MDLSTLDTRAASDAGAALHLRHPVTDLPLYDEETKEPVTITLLGRDSAEWRQAEKAQAARRIERLQRTGRSVSTAEEQEAEAVEMYALATKTWQHIVVRGEKWEPSRAAARRLYSEPGLRWIREQVDAFIYARAHFLGN